MADFTTKNLRDDEEIIEIIRSYSLTFFPKGILAVFVILLAFFFLFPLFNAGVIGKIGFFILLIGGCFFLARVVANYYFNCLVITNQRLIDYDQKGLFERHVTEARYNKIQDVSYRQKGFLQMILNYGTLEIQTAGIQQKIEAKKLKNPQRIQQLIMDVQQEYRDK